MDNEKQKEAIREAEIQILQGMRKLEAAGINTGILLASFEEYDNAKR